MEGTSVLQTEGTKLPLLQEVHGLPAGIKELSLI